MKKNSIKQLVAVKTRNEKNYWTRIGVAYENPDGSWNPRFDYIPTDATTTIQLRDLQRRDGGRAGEDEGHGSAAPF